jgi:hypothetical protein
MYLSTMHCFHISLFLYQLSKLCKAYKSCVMSPHLIKIEIQKGIQNVTKNEYLRYLVKIECLK